MNFDLKSLGTFFIGLFTQLKTWITSQIADAKDELKGGVAASYDSLGKLYEHFTSQISTINTTLGQKADTTAVTSAINAAKSELKGGATELTDFAAVETETANIRTLIGSVARHNASGGDIVNIAATLSFPSAPVDDDSNVIAGKQIIQFNEVPGGPASGTMTSAILADAAVSAQVAPYVSGQSITLTDGDMLMIDYDENGDVVSVEFHDDDKAAKISAALSVRNGDIADPANDSKFANNGEIKAYFEGLYADSADFEAFKTQVQSQFDALFPNE